MLSDTELLSLNSQGFIPGPDETEEIFLKRIAALQAVFEKGEWIPRPHWDWVRAHLKEIFDFEPHSLPAFYSNRGLTPWQGAASWIENGKLTFPVSEITIASTMQQMLQGIEQVGSDLEFRGSIAAPTILIREMTISGQ